MKTTFIILSLIIIMLCQASFIFVDAKRHGEKHYFIWGLFGLVHCPSSIIIYLIVTRIIFKRVECKSCHKVINASDDFKYCPYCREELKK